MMELAERKVKYGPAFWPLLNNGEHITLDVMEGGRRLATALTGVDRRAARLTGVLRGYFALFSAEDRADAVRMLAAGMADWQRGQGMRSLFGPVAPDGGGFSMGVQVDGFGAAPELLSPANPPYCDGLLLGAGFAAETDWLSFDLELDGLRRRRYAEAADWAMRRRGMAVRAVDPLRRRADCHALHRAMGIGERIDEAAFADQLARLRPHLCPALTLVAERGQAPCGMLMGLMDRRTGLVRIATAHIAPEARRSGALLCLAGGMVRALERVGPARITAGVIDATNQASIAACLGAGGVPARRYRQYTFSL